MQFTVSQLNLRTNIKKLTQNLPQNLKENAKLTEPNTKNRLKTWKIKNFKIRINLSCWIRIQEGKNDPQR